MIKVKVILAESREAYHYLIRPEDLFFIVYGIFQAKLQYNPVAHKMSWLAIYIYCITGALTQDNVYCILCV